MIELMKAVDIIIPLETLISGRQAVAHNGIGSVIHQVAINATVAAAQRCSASSPSDSVVRLIVMNRSGPSINPARCLASYSGSVSNIRR